MTNLELWHDFYVYTVRMLIRFNNRSTVEAIMIDGEHNVRNKVWFQRFRPVVTTLSTGYGSSIQAVIRFV